MGMREWYWGSGKSSKRGRGNGGPPDEDNQMDPPPLFLCCSFIPAKRNLPGQPQQLQQVPPKPKFPHSHFLNFQPAKIWHGDLGRPCQGL
ncbi:hypothetical protein ACFX1R_004131 [Malus domestica]